MEAFLGDFKGTLLSDGYAAYAAYARQRGIVHAQCWSHCRRNFVDAKENEPEAVAEALSLIGALYAHEKTIRKKKLDGPAKLAYRREHSTPTVDAFFAWCRKQRERLDLLPSKPARAGVGVCGGAGIRVAGVPREPGCIGGHEFSREGTQADTDRSAQLVVCLKC